jgi:hypothetical protein
MEFLGVPLVFLGCIFSRARRGLGLGNMVECYGFIWAGREVDWIARFGLSWHVALMNW